MRAQPNLLFAEIDGCTAEFSPDRIYRYTLTRQWDDGKCVAWLMFNPSTADEAQNDPTIRKCIGFSRRWGYGRLVILNLYSVRNSNPRAVARIADPVGPMNDYWIKESLKDEGVRELVCAWGCAQHEPNIDARVRAVLANVREVGTPVVCLGYRDDGHPRHPLMVSYSVPRETFHIRTQKDVG